MKKLVFFSLIVILGLSANVANANVMNSAEVLTEAGFYIPGKKVKNKKKSPKRRIKKAKNRKYPCTYQG